MNDNLDEKLLASPYAPLASEDVPPVEANNNTNNHHDNNDMTPPPPPPPPTATATIPSSWSVTPGERQPTAFRDVIFAVLFVIHLLIILVLSTYSCSDIPNTATPSGEYSSTFSTQSWLGLCITTGLVALGISAAALHLLTQCAEQLLQITLGGQVFVNGLLVLWFVVRQFWWGVLGTGFFFVLGLLYARAVWHRIPYCAANLRLAVTAIQNNGGILFVAVAMAALWLLWTVLWFKAWLGVYVRHVDCSSRDQNDDNNKNNNNNATPTTCTSHTSGGVILLFVLSYAWTTAVGRNILRVTVAGVVGTFCIVPQEASHVWSPAIVDSWRRATTYSLGSICLGSLLTTLLQLLYQFCRETRRHCHRYHVTASCCLCVLECLVGFLERIVVYFNKWSYCYIGLYGYDYLTAGRTVLQLFRDRGWTAVWNDTLIQRALVLASVVVGLATGAVGMVLARLWPSLLGAFPRYYIFLGPAVLGGLLAYLLLTSVVEAAVDTIVVVFAENPQELERNHTGLYQQMATAWRMAYPDEFRL